MSPQFCVVIVDSFPGLEGGRCAGMCAIAIRSKYASSLHFPQASFAIESPKSLHARKLEALLSKRTALKRKLRPSKLGWTFSSCL